MIGGAIIVVGLCIGGGNTLRDRYEAAPTPMERIDAGLALLDDVLVRQWSANLTVELAMVGLPDTGRRDRAAAILDDAIVVSDAVDVAIRDLASRGERVRAEADRWQVARGLACAAAVVLGADDIDLAEEAVLHLQQAAARMGDSTGRFRRSVAAVRAVQGDCERAAELAREVAEGASTTPLQRTLAETILIQCGALESLTAVLIGASDEWQVAILGEAIIRAAPDSASALAWIGPVRNAFARTGLPAPRHGELAVSMAASLGHDTVLSDEMVATLDPAAIIGVVRVASDEGAAGRWMDTLAERAGVDADTHMIGVAHARSLRRRGHAAAAMRAWRAVALLGGSDAAGYWDEAGHDGIQVLNRTDGRDSDQARLIVEQAASNGTMRSAWLRSLSAFDAREGDVDAALIRLAAIAPAGAEHLRALRDIGVLLCDRKNRIGRWSDGDNERLDAARRAAVAAASQRIDQRRAAMAMPIAASLAAAMIEYTIDVGDLEAARRLRETDAAIDWLQASELAFLDLRMAALGGECHNVDAALRLSRADPQSQHADLVVKAVAWAGRASAADANRPARPRALACILDAIRAPHPAGSPATLTQIAEAFRRGGQCDWAVAWYDAALDADSALLPAVLGRCECLRESDDRAVLADVARGYRRIAALPRADDPARWRLAQTRLLGVLRRAGADPRRLDARLARLRAIDPLVGSPSGGQ